MPGSVILPTGLDNGPVGAISQTDFPLVSPRFVRSTDTLNINFGDPVVINADDTVSSVAQFILLGGTLLTTTQFGIAVQNTKTNAYYPLGGGTAMAGGYYAPGEACDILIRGTINVQINNGTPVTQYGVYVRKILDASIPKGVVGGFEAVADTYVGTDTIGPFTNVVFRRNTISADGVATVTILNRVLA
jgi:hypothetical protein